MSEAAALRSARRQLARRLHPDLGGDPEAYLEAMAALDAHAARAASHDAVVVGRTGRLRRALPVRRVRGAVRRVQQHLPRHLPGARRWARL
ncbi:hypothetical protein [Aquipuribacter sp. SD81]|uniref:hypothetical protein n=1 Tax=Aquipuribacter sp. SD81 TaxID=3127703 RepID=UPI0030163593